MDRRDDMMRHFPAILNRWKGGDAQLWNISSCHPTLAILVTKKKLPGCLVIHCTGPERIEAPRVWAHCNFTVTKAAEMFDLIDQEANVRVFECGVSLSEHPKKPWEQ